ncbi:hypothetical protein LOTGIDRAFT_169231 [Lottia gigantea]|uniref:Uncharacterized protein n=1 Tax=Lottia gigantea TaxID=225164 RepID=V3YZD3_LOTGI|nr:hypothetical protein LOTGIDRAFT_169231 [Lottia gigantea]ESO83538.1 hypothetical protein LOTGIDRAFT_169231 [Lottia gigantea]
MLYKLLLFGLWFSTVRMILFILHKFDIVYITVSRILFILRKNDIVYITVRMILFILHKKDIVYITVSMILFILHKKDIGYITQVGYCLYDSKKDIVYITVSTILLILHKWDIGYITVGRILIILCKVGYYLYYISRILFILQQAIGYCFMLQQVGYCILYISGILGILQYIGYWLYYIDGVAIDKTSINMQITDVSRITSLIFHVKACRDAHFFFYSDLYQLVKIAVLGSSGDCDIRLGLETFEVSELCTVDCYQFKPFWISWQSNYMRLGYGNIVDQQSVVSGTSPLTFNLAYLSLMRYENFTWEIEYPGKDPGIQDFKFIRHTNTRSMSILNVQTTRSVSLCGISCKLSTDCFGFNYNPSLSYDNCELLTSFQLIDKNNPELQLQIIHPYDWNLYITKFP